MATKKPDTIKTGERIVVGGLFIQLSTFMSSLVLVRSLQSSSLLRVVRRHVDSRARPHEPLANGCL